MALRLKAIFSSDWQYILDAYHGFLRTNGSKVAKKQVLLDMIEIGVRFGERLFKLSPNGFVEIGCGLAIPSLTMAKLGNTRGRAVDIDNKVIGHIELLKDHLGCNLEIQCRDIFVDRPHLDKGELLITEKPASYKKNILEVEYHISNWCKIEGYNFAMIPSYLGTDSLGSYSDRCTKYKKKLRQVGFKVENKQISKKLPLRWLIAFRPPFAADFDDVDGLYDI